MGDKTESNWRQETLVVLSGTWCSMGRLFCGRAAASGCYGVPMFSSEAAQAASRDHLDRANNLFSNSDSRSSRSTLFFGFDHRVLVSSTCVFRASHLARGFTGEQKVARVALPVVRRQHVEVHEAWEYHTKVRVIAL